MLRRLLSIASIVCLVASMALMGMWVRSYSDMEEWRGRLLGSNGFLFISAKGRLTVSTFALGRGDAVEVPQNWPWEVWTNPNGEQRVVQVPPRAMRPFLYSWGFDVMRYSLGQSRALPYWFLTLVAGSLAMAFRLRWPFRFTLRGLFAVTTFVATVLGMIAWLDRAWIGK